MTESLEFGEKKKRVIAAEHKATRALTGGNADRKTKGEWDASIRQWTGEQCLADDNKVRIVNFSNVQKTNRIAKLYTKSTQIKLDYISDYTKKINSMHVAKNREERSI